MFRRPAATAAGPGAAGAGRVGQSGSAGIAAEVFRGLVAAAAAVLAMAGVAAAGLALLGAGRVGDLGSLTAAAVALAVGGTVEAGAVPAGGLPVAVRGSLDVLPLGVSLAGAVVLGTLLLRRREDGWLVRGAVAAVALPAGLAVIALTARGTLSLPERVTTGATGLARLPLSGGLDAGFSVAVGPTVAGAAAGAFAVVGGCLLVTRFPVVATALRAARWPAAGLGVLCLAAAFTFGGTVAAGGVLLALPQLVGGAVLLGLGVPWTISPSSALPVSPGGPLLGLSAVVLLGAAVSFAAASRRPGGPLRRAAGLAVRFAPVTAAVLAAGTLLSRASLDVSVGAFGLSLPVFAARLTANPLLALVAGLAGGAVAGFAGSLLADAISVSSRVWKR
ncbi:streptophobe family protein [Amycolatopsis sp. MtRt-6]|uniref:streptophobe family protein n=1 Tax=Amycolatopsis sp. MtRt-6 TaxID=2792782 RepID=UPI0027DD43D3|nr:streptophobe family protein [Amycolatopsis sp. MtRt-6]